MRRRRVRLAAIGAIALGLGPGASSARADSPGSFQDNAGLRVTFGRAFVTGIDTALYERIELEAFSQVEASGGWVSGPMIGMIGGLEMWAGFEGSGGFGLPLGLNLGMRRTLLTGELPLQVFVLAGLGADTLMWDFAKSHTGFGLFAPYSTAGAGFDVAFVRLMVDATAQYRWQWGADDRFLFGLGGALGVHAPL